MFKQYSKLATFTLTGILGGLIVSANVGAVDQAKAAVALKPQDFAYGMALNFTGQDAVYQTSLPLNIYQGTTRGDLGDLRVFNAQGEVVPHMLRQLANSSTGKATLSKLAFFPLQGAAGAELDQLSIRVKRNIAGTLIDIGSDAKPAALSRLSGYLLDASAIRQPLQALELDWTHSSENFTGTLQIESSDDLKHWALITRGAPLASLQFGGHSLLQRRIEFPAIRAKYVRLSWPQQQAPLKLTSISAELAGTRVEAPLTWLAVNASAVPDKAGEYEFDLGAHLPVQRVRIELPQMNTLVQTALFSRERAADSWRQVSNAMLYKLHSAGQDLKNPDIAVAAGNNRYWLLRVERQGGGMGSEMPQMHVGWQPHQLLFVARGSPPFQLAYGSSEIKPAEFQMQNLLPSASKPSTAKDDSSDLKIQSAQTGLQMTLGGEARLNPPPLPHPWKKWILWGVLSVSVLLLAWMAYRLVKQMENHDTGGRRSSANK